MTETLKVKNAVTCPYCRGECFTEEAEATNADRSCLCETCGGSGHVPAKWTTMYAYSCDKTCDYCGEPRGAAWDGELFTCVKCWEGKHGN